MNNRKYSLWLYFGLSVSIVLAALLGVVWYASDRFQDFFIHHQQDTLKSRAITVSQSINDLSGIKENNCQVLQISDKDIRVTIIDRQGEVLCDSDAESESMENHATRPEINRALSGQPSSAVRFSATLQTSMLYLAIPHLDSEKVVAVVRAAISLASVDDLLGGLYKQFLVLLAALIATISVVVIIVYRKINQPLSEIAAVATRFSDGKFEAVIPDYDIREVAELGVALNSMAEQLGRLESLRQDFVANVSHELKTPIATVKSYVETLLDGSQHDAEDIEYFLNVIQKQNDRLAAIVDDLLMLSRLESSPAYQALELIKHEASELLRASAEICQIRADVKNIRIHMRCSPDLLIQIDHSLMTQAIVNLLDNAIKYSADDTTITLSAKRVNKQIELAVCDQGSGIPEKDIPRLFERFYRVDKSRSRRIGGTGLGLAIVKHIVGIHHGRLTVVNNTDAGCCFTIFLNAQVVPETRS